MNVWKKPIVRIKIFPPLTDLLGNLSKVVRFTLWLGIAITSFGLVGCGSALWPDPTSLKSNSAEGQQASASQSQAKANPWQENQNRLVGSVSPSESPKDDSPGGAGSPLAMPPVMNIKFKQDNTAYQQSLFALTNQIIATEPSVSFQLLVIATGSSQAEKSLANQYGLRVRQTLLDMGVPMNRIRMMQAVAEGSVPMVNLYLVKE